LKRASALAGVRSEPPPASQKRVPAIVYGGAAGPQLIDIDHNEILLNLGKEAFHASVLTLNIDGVAESVVLRDSQRHPWKPLILHCDFQRVDAVHAIHQRVPLHFINADIAPGVKISGGNVSHTHNDIEVSCLPQDLPAYIEVDLKDLEAGHAIHASELVFPAGRQAGGARRRLRRGIDPRQEGYRRG
jgi:large subunit ribosomal protein L25